MIPLNNEPQMDKNYWLALILSMLILIGYPFLMRRFQKPAPPPAPAGNMVPQTAAPEQAPPVKPLSAAEGPFLEKQTPPSLIPFDTPRYEIRFSTLGASINHLRYKGEAKEKGIAGTLFYDGDPSHPGIFTTRFSNDAANLEDAVFKLFRRSDPNIFDFVYEKPGDYRITKQYVLSDKPGILLNLTVENLSAYQKHFPVELTYGLDYGFDENKVSVQRNVTAVISSDGKIESEKIGKIEKKGFLVSREIAWAGVLEKYFAILVKPDWKAVASESKTEGKVLRSSLRMDPLSVDPQQKITRQFFIYAGPQRYETLKRLGQGFEDILSRGFFGLFKIGLLLSLKFFNQYTRNFGWAIILLTLILKGVFTPLTHMSYESMKKMQALQPKLKSLQERYKNDPAKLNREMMELYKRNRVNPMSGCLPMLLQIPIFIAFYQVLDETIELKGAPFIFWIHDLSQPDRLATLPFSLPFIGNSFNLLPLFMIGSMFWQQKLTPQAGSTPEQTQVMQFMPLIFGLLFYQMPSGLVLYWFVNNTLTIIHQLFLKRVVVVLHHEDKD